MTPILADLLQTTEAALAAGVVVFLRIGAAMAVVPAFGEQTVPVRVRLVVALAFTAVVAPAVAPSLGDSRAIDGVMMLSEPIIGLALGLALRLFVIALQIAGAIAAQSTSLSQLFGTQALEPQPAIGHLITVAGLALAVMAGLHVKLAMVFIGSYDVLPAGQIPAPGDLGRWGIGHIARAFALGFTLAAPFVIAGMIYNLALGVINRAMPQLMVALVGAPAITLGGLALLLVSLPIALEVWRSAMDRFLTAPFG